MPSKRVKCAAKFLPKIKADLARREEEYRRECEEAARDGFRPQFCRHGVDMWRYDFDGACWRCENGEDDNAYSIALARADNYLRDIEKAFRIDRELSESNVSRELRERIVDEILRPYLSS